MSRFEIEPLTSLSKRTYELDVTFFPIESKPFESVQVFCCYIYRVCVGEKQLNNEARLICSWFFLGAGSV